MESAAPAFAPQISEPLSWAAICVRYPDQWVCLVEMARVEPHNFAFRSARVVGHGKTRRDPLVQARPWRTRYDSIGHYFTGPITAPFPRSFP